MKFLSWETDYQKQIQGSFSKKKEGNGYQVDN